MVTLNNPARLFLAPATAENIAVSISQPVQFDWAMRIADARTIASLETMLGGRVPFRCWAMTESSRGVFDKMGTGDAVMLSVRGSGRFDYLGHVCGKVESATLGKRLWPVQIGLPWNLIYVLRDVRQIAARKDKLVVALGYDPAYRVPGVVCVSSAGYQAALERFETVDALIAYAAGQSIATRDGEG